MSNQKNQWSVLVLCQWVYTKWWRTKKKKICTLSCSIKNRAVCPYLLKDKMFWYFEKRMSMSLCKKLTDQKKRWASYPAQLRTGQNAHICWKIKCFDILKKNVNEFTQKVDGPKKKMGTLSCSVKNRTECP